MKNLTLIVTLSLLSFGCQKDDPNVNVPLGESQFFANGSLKTPKVERASDHNAIADNFEVNFEVYDDTNVWPVESMFIFKVPKKAGKYPLRITSYESLDGLTGANYYTLSDQGDVLEELYIIDESAPDNYIEVTLYDKKLKQVAGKINATFVIDPDRGKINPISPDTLRITNGEFYLQL